LDKNYPKSGRNRVKSLEIFEKNLEGKLDLSDFINLEEIIIRDYVDRNKVE
jgi:hypothetical protein